MSTSAWRRRRRALVPPAPAPTLWGRSPAVVVLAMASSTTLFVLLIGVHRFPAEEALPFAPTRLTRIGVPAHPVIFSSMAPHVSLLWSPLSLDQARKDW